MEFQQELGPSTDLEVTAILAADPAALTNFAVTMKTDLEKIKLINEHYKEPRLVTYCKQE